jgi:hypothetical protein
MAQWDRWDILEAHRALENDWNHGGWLRERPSNQRRMESSGIQMMRMGYEPSPFEGGCFEALNYDQQEIYCNALANYGMGRMLSRDDETHTEVIEFIERYYVPGFVREHFPTLINHG